MTRRTRSASRQPGPSRKRPRLAAREPSILEVIELTDSDNDLPVPQKNRPQPGPSHPTPARTSDTALTFGKPRSDIFADAPAAAPGSSQHVVCRERQGGSGPLFLPGSDDEEHGTRLPPVPVAQDAPDAAPAHPPLPRPEPAAPQAPLADPIDEYIVRVLEIVPDVQPIHAHALIEQVMQSQPGNVIEFVLHALFENPSYPKTDEKGKHKRVEPDGVPDARGSPKPKEDYVSKERVYNCGPQYLKHSLEQLMVDFPRIPKPHIRSRLLDNRFYAPTYLLLTEELKKETIPFKLKSTNSVVGKGKTREDPEFDKEREWVLLKVAELATEKDAALAASVNHKEYEDNGEGIECGCCFSGYPFDQMIQCPEAHLFCKSCMTSYASNLLGEHNPNIVCMDQSGCKLPFPESELCRFLSSKLLELYYRVKQQKEIEAAGLENLEECPFCEYKCVIENEMEKLFRCENPGCSAITCRMCKKPDHLPKTCQEVEEDKHLDAKHVIEEAMTQALMRSCPKCQKSFIKEMGCNKMTCPGCYTVSCYICRKIISNGYEHFSNPPPYSGKMNKSKCNLWDPVEQRHAQEVSEAAKRALAEIRKSRPDVDETNLKVDIPVAQERPGAAHYQAPIGLDGGMPLPAYMIGRGVGMGGPGVGPRMGGIGAGVGAVAGMGAPPMGLGIGVGVGNNPFMFGAGQAHQFAHPALGALHRAGLDRLQAQAREAVMPVVPAMPLPRAGGLRAREAQFRALVPPAMEAGGRKRRRKAR
ncbi:hypothetical protein J3R82DRAFT_7275 [Butyriboletus roseoflavus]|nr:hypothetical protein J3R82DRAFT_7275 [Butyriboletus roseoflavus]